VSEAEFGFKKLALDDWKQSDPEPLLNGLHEADWVAEALRPRLNATVPFEVHRLFEVARAGIIYGWFFHPLAQLGADQLLRTLDTAVRMKCDALGIPTTRITKKGAEHRATFAENIEQLLKKEIVPKADEERWFFTRRARNRASHPEDQYWMPPGFLLGMIQSGADRLNSLFP